jgi:hypothetical protein
MDESAVTVPESAWLTQLRAISWSGFACDCPYSDRWVAALCTHLPRLTHLTVMLPRHMTSATLSILANAERLSALEVHIFRTSNASDAEVGALLQRSRALRSLCDYSDKAGPMPPSRARLDARHFKRSN